MKEMYSKLIIYQMNLYYKHSNKEMSMKKYKLLETYATILFGVFFSIYLSSIFYVLAHSI